jgi:hypothetical protein
VESQNIQNTITARWSPRVFKTPITANACSKRTLSCQCYPNSNSCYGLHNYTEITVTSSAPKIMNYLETWNCWILYRLYVNYTCVSVRHTIYVTCNCVIITCGLVIRISKEAAVTIFKTPWQHHACWSYTWTLPVTKNWFPFHASKFRKLCIEGIILVKKNFQKFQLPSQHCFFLYYTKPQQLLEGILLNKIDFFGFSINANYIWWMPEALKQEQIVTHCFFISRRLCFFTGNLRFDGGSSKF